MVLKMIIVYIALVLYFTVDAIVSKFMKEKDIQD